MQKHVHFVCCKYYIVIDILCKYNIRQSQFFKRRPIGKSAKASGVPVSAAPRVRTIGKRWNSGNHSSQGRDDEKVNVIIWSEFIHERGEAPVGALIRKIYPDGIHNALAENLAEEDLSIRAVSLDMPEQGLPDEVLNSTDVLVWWGHCVHAQVADALVDRMQNRVQHGMVLVELHSGHLSKIFRRMLGTQCRLLWREIGEKERIWVVDRSHPVAQGGTGNVHPPHTEM